MSLNSLIDYIEYDNIFWRCYILDTVSDENVIIFKFVLKDYDTHKIVRCYKAPIGSSHYKVLKKVLMEVNL